MKNKKSKKRSFKEIREHVQKVINRPPSKKQLADLKKTFKKINT